MQLRVRGEKSNMKWMEDSLMSDSNKRQRLEIIWSPCNSDVTDSSGNSSPNLGPEILENVNPEMETLESLLDTEDPINETSWLTSTSMDLVLYKIALKYPKVYFLPTDFVPLHLNGSKWNCLNDILGRKVNYDGERPFVFVANIGNVHWNLFRLQIVPNCELQLFEPMGRPASRHGISLRHVPHGIMEWVDDCFPKSTSWKKRTVSAITNRQQRSGFDCGVACLLYADKCGQGLDRFEINEHTSQLDITSFRTQLTSILATYRNSRPKINNDRIIPPASY